jgi:hypothetical protein
MAKKFDRKTIVQGDHVLEINENVVKEFVDEDVTRDRFLKDVVDKLNKRVSNIPDYDTGYFPVVAQEDYEIEHNLGYIPTRMIAYFCTSKAPNKDKKDIFSDWSGSWMNMSNKYITYRTGSNLGQQNSWVVEGYLRIMLWR